MSRVERTENPTERRGSEQLREAQRGRGSSTPQRDKPSKAEGEVGDVEEALRHQSE
ncbi:MAG TPA: hypothetical protein VM733_16170 [Thermoanaerobaculia bacterium]|nr:hypothetical protein [Thermoanaerobaculia bacterium]